MNKRLFKLFIVFILLLLVNVFCACTNEKGPDPDPGVDPPLHEHVESDWYFEDENIRCNEKGTMLKSCTICGEILDSKEAYKRHEYVKETIEATCTKNGKQIETCKNCDYYYETIIYSKGHTSGKYEIIEEAPKDGVGIKAKKCTVCDEVIKEAYYANNGYLAHGKLSVNGTDLVDENGEKFQLYGVSTHGLQWYGHLVTYDILSELNLSFGNNIMRFSLYTAEGGYCEANADTKKVLLQRLIDGVEIATELGIYAIIDWHMLGAEDDNDKNPLYYLDESKEFFSYISEYFKDNVNVLYEIMNEPCGSTTWADCKRYAEEVIPCIRENTDGIILVGSDHWSSNLSGVYRNPLQGFDNIMYTYHFYAADITYTTEVVNNYKRGLPVFISEFGFMDADGDGNLNYKSGNEWIKILDERNISYVAWNLSYSRSSSGILKYNTQDRTDFSDDNLKEWGQVLRGMYREKSGLNDFE